ncbi:MAG TPA: hypothetical protein DEA96_19515 [Leptospiraceae bacterium]|nr:hypothetical protein [Leptospiraceae bacterium]
MNEIIALGLPGVTCLFVLRFIRRDRTKTGWDYLLLAGLLGALSFAISRWLIYTVLKSRYPELVSIAQDTVAELFGARPYLPSYIGSFFVAIGLAYCIQISIVLSQQRHVADLIRFFFRIKHLPGDRDPLQLLEPNAAYIVTTENNQVYIGTFITGGDDPDEPSPSIAIQVIFSGRRQSGKGAGVQYFHSPRPSGPNTTIIPVEKISTITQFELRSFLQSISSGYSRIPDFSNAAVILRLFEAKAVTLEQAAEATGFQLPLGKFRLWLQAIQERVKMKGRDLYRTVLGIAARLWKRMPFTDSTQRPKEATKKKTTKKRNR